MKYLWLTLLLTSCAFKTKYPATWWEPAPTANAPAWEILPQAADKNKEEVILSKRNELGVLSNFAATPFYFEGKRYASIEGFWQMMKYPESKKDPRSKWGLRFTRDQVAAMSGFEAKAAGDEAEMMMKEKGVDWVTYNGEKLTYCSKEKKEHYRLIREVMIKKLRYNPEARRVLLATGKLKLRPDHFEEACEAPEWKYYEMWMQLRKEVMWGWHLAPIMLPNS